MNRRLIKTGFNFLLVLTVLASLVSWANAQKRRSSIRPVSSYTVQSGTTIRTRLNQELNSERARMGETFTSTTVDPVYSTSGVLVIPAGSTVTGRVTQVTSARSKSNAGTISVAFTRVRLPNGYSRPIVGSLTDQGESGVTADPEGQVKGSSSKKRNAVFIGGGAVGGAAIGGIAGGGKGAGIGAAIGAGAGVLGSLFSKGKEAVIKPGTEFGVIIERSVRLPRYN
ncbi:MAG: hypothetical protein ACRD4L_09345, partial [Pyrinomonadaceae bacterium]